MQLKLLVLSFLFVSYSVFGQDTSEESNEDYMSLSIQYAPRNLALNRDEMSSAVVDMFGLHSRYYGSSWDLNALFLFKPFSMFTYGFCLGYHQYSGETVDDDPSWGSTDPDLIISRADAYTIGALRGGAQLGLKFFEIKKFSMSGLGRINALWLQKRTGNTVNRHNGGYSSITPIDQSMREIVATGFGIGLELSYLITEHWGISLQGFTLSSQIPLSGFGFNPQLRDRREISLSIGALWRFQ